jgi:hypothetical protein
MQYKRSSIELSFMESGYSEYEKGTGYVEYCYHGWDYNDQNIPMLIFLMMVMEMILYQNEDGVGKPVSYGWVLKGGSYVE